MTVRAIREAEVEQLQEVAGIGPSLAAQISSALRSDEPQDVAVDMATGEIIDG